MIEFLLAASLASAPVDRHQPVWVRFMGSIECSAWPIDQEPGHYTKAPALSWVLGYLTATAMERNVDLLERADSVAVSRWMDNYCRDNPLDNIIQGAASLRDELLERRSRAIGQ